MADKYLNLGGLSTLWAKIKEALAKKQDKLTFDAAPKLGSSNPVTSDGVRRMATQSTRVDNLTEDVLIYQSEKFSGGSFDKSFVFGLQYGDLMKLHYRQNVYPSTTTLTLKLLNAAAVRAESVKGLRASICQYSDGSYCFAMWIDHTAGMLSATYFVEYFPDFPNSYAYAKHLAPFDRSQFQTVTDLTIRYQPAGLPSIPASGSGVLRTTNGALSWGAAPDAHTHANKAVLDGITAEDVDAWNTAADNSYSLTGGEAKNYGIFLGMTTTEVGVSQIFSMTALVLVRTLEDAAAFVVDVNTHGATRKYSLTQVDGTADFKFSLAIVQAGTSGNSQYQYGVYLYPRELEANYWSVRVVPWRSTYVVWGPMLLTAADRDNVKPSAYQTPADLITDRAKVDGSNATAAGVSAAINKLSAGTAAPSDGDYYVSQYAGGGTTTTSYHRRPVSALFEYIKTKLGTVGSATQPVYFSNGIPVKCSSAIPATTSASPAVSSTALNARGYLYAAGNGAATTSQAAVGMCWSDGSKFFTIAGGSGTCGGRAYFAAGNNSENSGPVEIVRISTLRVTGNVGLLVLNPRPTNAAGAAYTNARYPMDVNGDGSFTADKTLAVDAANTLMFRLAPAGRGYQGFGTTLFTGNVNVFATLDTNGYVTIASGAAFENFATNQVYTAYINLIK